MALQFKFVELSIVTDEMLEQTVNDWVGRGWHLEGIRFVTTEHSKRPAMAFVSFTREAAQHAVDREPPRRPPPLVRPEPEPANADGLLQPGSVQREENEPSVLVATHGNDVE